MKHFIFSVLLSLFFQASVLAQCNFTLTLDSGGGCNPFTLYQCGPGIAIIASALGASSPTYTWSGGATGGGNAFFDTPGIYSLTVTDAMGCSEITDFEINYIGSNIDQSNLNIVHPTCGQANGSITGIEVLNYQGFLFKNEAGTVLAAGTSSPPASCNYQPINLTNLPAGTYTLDLNCWGTNDVTFTLVGSPSEFTLNQTTCNPSEAGTTTTTYTNAAGCDSIVTVITTLLESSQITQNETTCNPSEAGTTTTTYTNAAGCDSIVTTITTLVAPTDLNVTQNNNTLSVNLSDATYQWVDCNNSNQAIVGATAQSFTPSTNGTYAVMVTQNGCEVYSECISVIISGIGYNNSSQDLKVQFDPYNNQIQFDASNLNAPEPALLQLFDLNGKVILQQSALLNGVVEIILPEVSKGLYFLSIQSQSHNFAEKVLIAK